jgi:hypothetical protein
MIATSEVITIATNYYNKFKSLFYDLLLFFFADDRLLWRFWDSSSDDGCVATRGSSVDDCVATRDPSVDVCDDIIGGIDRGSSDMIT